MKKVLFRIILPMVVLFAAVACGDSIEVRKASFEKRIDALSDAGIDVKKETDGSYLLSVKDAEVATNSLLGLVNMSALDLRSRKRVVKAIEGAKIGIIADWAKYAQNSDKSLFAYYRGNGKEGESLTKLIAEKKLGAYLTFDAEERLKKIEFKTIDEKISKGLKVAHIVLKGARIDIGKIATEESPGREFVIKGGEFRYEIENNGTKEFTIGYHDPVCNIEKSNAYLGKQDCTFPRINITAHKKDTVSVVITDSTLKYEASLHGKKVKADALFGISSVDMAIQSKKGNTVVHLKDFKGSGFSDNMDEALLQDLYRVTSSRSKDANKTIQRHTDLLRAFFANDIQFNYALSLASVEGTSTRRSKTTHFSLGGFQGKAELSLGDTINYKERSQVASIRVEDARKNRELFEVKNFRFGYEIKEMHNFIPAFMKLATSAAQKKQHKKLAKANAKKMAAVGAKIVNEGFGLSLFPVGVDRIVLNDAKKKTDYGKMDLELDAQLNQNDVKLGSPMSAMLLLSYLQADGRIVLSKADLDQMAKQFSPKMIAMVMMYAKFEGDQAVFVLKFEKGQLMVNGKRVM